ncbi:MAG: hypothetical protein EZS28_012441 [Streblomastix strix]|uniref:Uncharacterized protein n=1 Tax=Streblomastix strix TaxID=222440 RepID=A0A5J4WBV0_9EUKA|nr:MAG: hypothetical protein EZS28_012441 [Streblomastix strix]
MSLGYVSTAGFGIAIILEHVVSDDYEVNIEVKINQVYFKEDHVVFIIVQEMQLYLISMNQEFSPIGELVHQFVFEEGLERQYLIKFLELVKLQAIERHQTSCGYYLCNMCLLHYYLCFGRFFFLSELLLRILFFRLYTHDFAI